MIGSWLGRALVALPALLAVSGFGAVVTGLTRDIRAGALVTGALAVAVLVRVASTGVVIDLDDGHIVLRSFWRTRRFRVDDLRRIDGGRASDGGSPGVRFVTTDGREFVSLALAYLDGDPADRLIARLRQAAGTSPTRISLDRDSFRPRAANGGSIVSAARPVRLRGR